MRSTRLVAESLVVMRPPVARDLPATRSASADQVAALCRAAWQPDRCTDPPPGWLRPGQHEPWRRVVAAIEAWGGAVLAESVGAGKSWIALAAAHHLAGRAMVVGPAALASQWMDTARRAGVPVQWHSHERFSRGRVPSGRHALVIVDEAHRFRHLDTRRARTLAPWLIGRRVLFLTATPIINRRADLVALLRLLVADDALALDGIASIRALEGVPDPPPALARLVIRSGGGSGVVPTHELTLKPEASEAARGRAHVRAVSRLVLGPDPGVRSLVATVLLDAASSSEAAWRASLGRYRALLLQSRDAGGLSRAALRRFAGPALDQLVLWPMLEQTEVAGAPPLEDLPSVEALLNSPSPPEAWLERLAEMVADQQPTICFTRHRATALALVRHLGDRTAWVTGDAAGIGPHRLHRHQVLAAFGPDRERWQLLRQRPNCLVCTEVLSEGLDLQGASRVVHLDLPWHASRLEQRNGRVRRIGQVASNVTVVVRLPVPAIERVLGLQRMVRHKGRLAERWLAGLTVVESPSAPLAPATWVAVATGPPGIEGVSLVGLHAGKRRGTIALVLRDGAWQPCGDQLPRPIEVEERDAITPSARGHMQRCVRRAVWRALDMARAPVVARPRLLERVLLLARAARHDRDHQLVHRLDRLLAVAGRQASLGFDQQLATLATASDQELRSVSLPDSDQPDAAVPGWALVVVFRGGKTPLR